MALEADREGKSLFTRSRRTAPPPLNSSVSLQNPMIAFDIEIDGKKVALAGVDDWSILSLHVNASRNEQPSTERDGCIDFGVGGLTLPNTEEIRHHFRWPTRTLEIGSVVNIRIVDSETVDSPSKRYRSDATIQESPFTKEELRQMRFDDYMMLKAEFEPSGG